MQSVTRRTVEVRMTRGPCRGQLILFEVETFAGTLVDEAIDPNADPRVDIVLEVAGGRGPRVGTLHARPYTFDPAWKYPWPELQDDASPLRRACRRGRVAALAAWKRRGVLPEEVQHFQVSGVTVSEAFQRCGLGLLLYETALGAVQQFGPAILTAQVCVPWTSATTSPQAAHVWGALRRRYEGGWFAVAPFQRRRGGEAASPAMVKEGESAVMVKRLVPPPRGRGAARDDWRTPWRERQRRQALVRAARLRAVQRVRQRHPELPAPVELLDVGMQGGWVFSTADPDTVVRVGDRFWEGRDELEHEELFLDPDFAPGVVQMRFLAASRKYVVAWKERVDLDVEGFLLRTHPETRGLEAAHALLGLWGIRATALRVLTRCAATQGLARAIRAGLPTGDLDLNSNLGVTRDGRVVAFDL